MEIFLILYMFFSLSALKGSIVLTKQIIWYCLGFFSYFIIKRINIKYIYNAVFIFYITFNILLLYLLLFGNYVNGARVWLNFGFISIQPSEFMKIILIIMLSLFVNKKNIWLIIITLIPSILTFLEPDTGNVVFYLISLFVVLLIKNKKMLIKPLLIGLTMFSLFVGLYFFSNESFIKIFGTSFFYRFDRVINLSSSFQLNEALKGMGCASLFGFKNNIYIPASTTDFIFSKVVILNGYLFSILFLIFNFIFDIYIIKRIKNMIGNKKVIAILTITMKIVQEIIHILMNIGLFPIMGITLPFISYGGSSIISYFIIFSIVDNHNRIVD